MLNPYISFMLTLPMINPYPEKIDCLFQDVVGYAVKTIHTAYKVTKEYNVRYVSDLF